MFEFNQFRPHDQLLLLQFCSQLPPWPIRFTLRPLWWASGGWTWADYMGCPDKFKSDHSQHPEQLLLLQFCSQLPPWPVTGAWGSCWWVSGGWPWAWCLGGVRKCSNLTSLNPLINFCHRWKSPKPGRFLRPGDNRERNFLANLRVSLRSGTKVQFLCSQNFWNTLLYIPRIISQYSAPFCAHYSIEVSQKIPVFQFPVFSK